jgi:hypothetical protein
MDRKTLTSEVQMQNALFQDRVLAQAESLVLKERIVILMEKAMCSLSNSQTHQNQMITHTEAE